MAFMNEFCDTPFWDLNVTWYTENPDFTNCFKSTALQWFPCLVLWILLPMELYNLKTSQMRDIPYNTYNAIKLTAIICIIGTGIVEFGDNVIKVALMPDVYSPFIKISTHILFLLLTWGNIKMGIRSSGILFMFSFSSVICGIPLARDTFRHSELFTVDIYDKSTLKRYIFVVYYLSTIIIFVLNCFVDRRPRYSLCAINDKISPSKNSSFLSDLYLCWFTEYIWKSYNRPLKDILWYVDYEDSSTGILPRFEKYWNKAIRKQKTDKILEVDGDCILLSQKPFVSQRQIKYSILAPILKLIWFEMLQGVVWRMSEVIMNLSSPLIFSLLITFIKEKEPIWKAYACVFLFFLSPFFQVIIQRKYFELILKIQIRVRAAILSLVYKKALKISNEARKEYSGGDILNLISVDTTRICEFIKSMNHIWSAPAQILISLYFLWGLFGTSTISSVIFIVFILIANHYVVKYSKMLRIKEMLSKDTRCKFLQEILSGIKVLKMYAWESSFEKIALDMRRKEMRYLKKLACLLVIMSLFFSSTPFLLPLVIFATYILSDVNNVLDVKKAFICVSFCNTFRTPMNHMPNFFTSLMQAYVAIKRINKFLNLEELDSDAVTHENREEALVIEDGKFSWENNQNSVTLRNINLKIKEGRLVAIVGPVGAGKSSLISAFLGEMYKLSGYVNVNGSTAYVPQQAWILNTSLKENITLGDMVDDTLYNKVIEACALKADLQTLSDGDLTEIGEKGINLSGGQKQRVSLARAVCSNKDIYFFDDPLSAVDFNVAEHIFQNVLGPEGILRTKTRVLVTHSTTFLHKMDLIIVLKKGSISESGTFNEIMRNDEEFAEFLRSYCKDVDEKIDVKDETARITQMINEEMAEMETIDLGYENTTEDEVENIKEKIQQIEHDSCTHTPKKLIDKERMESGNIKLKVYSYYVKIAGPFFVFSTIVLYLLFQCFSVISNSWLAKWTQRENTTSKDEYRIFYLCIYIIIGLCQEICIVLANSSMFKFLLQASLVLYNNLLINILQWPMSHFDSTPVGRIINRFTVDIDALDNNLGNKLIMLFLFTSKLLAVSVVIITNSPSCALFILPTIMLMYIIQKFYMVLSHQLKRVDSVYRSPLYSHFVETASGLESIRAYNIQEKFIKKILDRNDLCSATAYSIFVCGRWLSMRLEILVGIIISLTSFFIISERDEFTEGTLAFIITYTIQISKEVNWMIVNLTEVENVIVSVERIKEFIDKPREPNLPVSSTLISTNWPAKGQITFQNYKLRYRDELDLVLKNVNFTIKNGEKVGIIGRTGAGKTSIILALFRIIEPADGKIFIDGVDISTISLHLLRSKLTVIPQDPVLFVGTLRFNLDPFDSYTDEVLWDVLDKAHLKDFVRGLPNSLYYKIEEGGGNLSFGQKQLICLARALLRKTKILVLDEATASVDLETDELIQRTLRKEFSDCTVLTIAHRLNTVQDYDGILVMDNGTVVEFDSPNNLLSNKNSIFYKLAMDSGLLIHEKRDNAGSG